MKDKKNSWYINTIRVLNFQPFFGEHEIILGYTREKFVTIIQGKGGSGKSALVKALVWALNDGEPGHADELPGLLNATALHQMTSSAIARVRVCLTDAATGHQLMVQRECVVAQTNGHLTVERDAITAQEQKETGWTECDFDRIKNAYFLEKNIPFFVWDFNEDPSDLIENILPVLKGISDIPADNLKDLITRYVLRFWKLLKYPLEPRIGFDTDDRMHLIYNYHDFLPSLASGDRNVLVFALLASIRHASSAQVPLIINEPFSRMDAGTALLVAGTFAELFPAGQMILLGLDGGIDRLDPVLNPLTTKKYHLVFDKAHQRNSHFIA